MTNRENQFMKAGIVLAAWAVLALLIYTVTGVEWVMWAAVPAFIWIMLFAFAIAVVLPVTRLIQWWQR